MARTMLQTLCFFLTLATLLPEGSAKPISSSFAKQKRADLQVVKTTVTEANVIDWIPIESQGDIASPPPAPPALERDPNKPAQTPKTELQAPGAELGPPGTVPVPRMNSAYLAAANQGKTNLPMRGTNGTEKRQYAGDHWYSSSDQNVDNLGGVAVFSLFDAYVQSNGDFSLLQTAVTKSDPQQTVESGWINFPDQVAQPHLFTFYTTNGYSQDGDNIGGWNQDQQGWVQVSSTIFPGTVLTPDSTIGGSQYEMQIQYQLYQGNWWLYAVNAWIGYYPATLFSANNPDGSLGGGSDVIFYYGEVFQTEGPYTTTDMGSGEFPDTGYGNSAYIHNMQYMDTSGNLQEYTAGWWDSDSTRYTHVTNYNSGTNWAQYVYLGGPGAGGVVGG